MWSNEEEQHSKELRKNEALQCQLSNSPQEDEDDGPPPGFDSIPLNLSTDENKEPVEDDDDGPPPGFLPISLKEYKDTEKIESFEENDDDDDGPPPGFHSVHAIKQDDDVSMPNSHSIPVIESEKGDGLNPNSQSGLKTLGGVSKLGFQSIPVMKEEKSGNGFQLGLQPASIEESEHGLQSKFNLKEDEKMGDGSEIGFQSVPNKEEEKGGEFELGSQPIPMIEDEKEILISEKEVGEEDDDEGPPPGWGSLPSAVSSGTAPEPTHVNEEENVGDKFDVGSQSVPMIEDGKERDGFELDSQSFPVKVEEKGSSAVKEKNEDKDGDDEGPPPGWDSFRPPRMPNEALSPPQLPPLTPVPTRPSATASGKAQMVCGSCRTLLSYSKGARFVQCSCCQTVNLVLEEHQVGQVKCRGCTVLLMYPYGAPSVQCSSCLFVTKIGVQNKRPPLSMQQGRPQMSANPVH